MICVSINLQIYKSKICQGNGMMKKIIFLLFNKIFTHLEFVTLEHFCLALYRNVKCFVLQENSKLMSRK